MRPHRLLVATALTGLTAGPLLTTPPASADTPTFLDRHEYANLPHGTTAKRVTKIADIPGRVGLTGGGYQTRRYQGWRTKGGRVTVLIVYRTGPDGRWRLDLKSVER